MSKTKAKLEFDCAFTPHCMKFTEGGWSISFSTRGETVDVNLQKDGEPLGGMRLPLYVMIALSQMGLGCLNGLQLKDKS